MAGKMRRYVLMEENEIIHNNDTKALKSGIWYTASNFMLRSIGFITTPIFTRLLTKEDFGAFNNFTSWISIATVFVTLNLESTLISARYDYKEKFDKYILSTLTLSSFSCLIWITVVNIFSAFFTEFLSMNSLYINAMFLYLMFLPAVHMFQTRERYYFEYRKTVVTSVVLSISTAVLSVAFVVIMKNKFAGRVAGFVLPTAVLGSVLYIYFIRKGGAVNFLYWKYAIPICLPYIPHLLSLNLLNSMDRVMITRFCGEADTALYSLAYNCGYIITMLMSSINNAYAPWLGEKIALNQRLEIRRFSKIYILAFCMLALGIMLIAPEILLIFGGESYLESIYVITPVAMGCICQYLYTMFVNIEQFKKKTVGMAVASMTAAVVNLVLNYIFIPRIGYLAAAYTTLAGYICLLVIHMYLVKRLGLQDVYSYKFVLTVLLAGICATIAVSFLYSAGIVRYVVIAFYSALCGLCLYKYKDRLLILVKKK